MGCGRYQQCFLSSFLLAGIYFISCAIDPPAHILYNTLVGEKNVKGFHLHMLFKYLILLLQDLGIQTELLKSKKICDTRPESG